MKENEKASSDVSYISFVMKCCITIMLSSENNLHWIAFAFGVFPVGLFCYDIGCLEIVASRFLNGFHTCSLVNL